MASAEAPNRLFRAQVRKWVDKVELSADTVCKKLALDALTGCLKESRVDTGRMRASWRVGVGAVDPSNEPPGQYAVPGQGAPPTGEELGKAESSLDDFDLGDVIYITNSVEYAQYINDRYGIIDSVGEQLTTNLDALVAEARAEAE